MPLILLLVLSSSSDEELSELFSEFLFSLMPN